MKTISFISIIIPTLDCIRKLSIQEMYWLFNARCTCRCLQRSSRSTRSSGTRVTTTSLGPTTAQRDCARCSTRSPVASARTRTGSTTSLCRRPSTCRSPPTYDRSACILGIHSPSFSLLASFQYL